MIIIIIIIVTEFFINLLTQQPKPITGTPQGQKENT
jgi:hypothetical protein